MVYVLVIYIPSLCIDFIIKHLYINENPIPFNLTRYLTKIGCRRNGTRINTLFYKTYNWKKNGYLLP